MKFLLWQFAVYALAAFVLGFAVAYLWWRPKAARLSRKLNAEFGYAAALQAEIADLKTLAQRDKNIVAAVAPLTEQLSVARSALTLVEAELEASALRHTMLTNQSVGLSERATRNENLASIAERAQSDALRTRVALDSAIAEHTANRAMSEQALADALARAQSAEASLANLRRAHERLVVESRRELTELSLRAEQAERITPNSLTVGASTVWQSAMVEATNAPPDDQILIVLPNETTHRFSEGKPGPSRTLNGELEATASNDSDHVGTTTLVDAVQSSPNLLIELRSSE